MRRVWLAGFLFACGSERDPWPEHRPRAREDAGERLIDAPLAIDAGLPVDTTGMVLIPGGPYLKGCPLGARTCSGAGEWNVKAFYMDQTEVTVAAYGACVTAGVVVVSYRDRASGVMREDGAGGGAFVEVLLRPEVVVAEASMIEAAERAHAQANEWCFIANSMNFPVRHQATVSALA